MNYMYMRFYSICNFAELIESRGVEPLLGLLRKLGGWPMIESNWDATMFDLLDVLTDLKKINHGYLVDTWVSADDRESTINIVKVHLLGYLLYQYQLPIPKPRTKLQP